jgi:hypothetical protein
MSKLQIRLGPQGLRYAQPGLGFKLLGTVQDGLAIGALAQLDDGSYAQVNGDFLRPLNASRVQFAANGKLRVAPPTSSEPQQQWEPSPPASTAAKPVVIVKKRRFVPTTAT